MSVGKPGGAAKGRPKPIGAGSQKGSRQLRTHEVSAIARHIVEHPRVQARLLAQAIDGTLPVELEKLLWHYAYGKPREFLELSGPGGGPIELFEVQLTWQPLPHHILPGSE